MQALTISVFGGPDVLRVADVTVPEPGPDQVRVKVHAAAVHPVDLATRAGAFAELLPPQPRYVLGWDVGRTVDAGSCGGRRVPPWRCGRGTVGVVRAVCGHPGRVCCHGRRRVARAEVWWASWVEAATLPLNALTAVQALKLMPGGHPQCRHHPAQPAPWVCLPPNWLFTMGIVRTRSRARRTKSLPREAFLRCCVPRLHEPGQRDPGTVAGEKSAENAARDAAGIGAEPALGAVRDGGSFVTTSPRAAPLPSGTSGSPQCRSRPTGGQLTELAALAEHGKN